MLDVVEMERALVAETDGWHGKSQGTAAEQAEPCGDCHFWHFGHCVHVTRYGTIGDGRCSHRKEARSILPSPDRLTYVRG